MPARRRFKETSVDGDHPMKCPACNHRQLRGKYGMTCQSCAYQFIFDPHQDRLQGRRLSDDLIQSVCYAASDGDTLVYTSNQLYAFACARHRYRWRKRRGWLAVFNPLLALGGRRAHLRRQAWDACLARWRAAGKALPGLLGEPALQQPPPAWDEPDIYDYGALGVLLCQHDYLVDWFVLNKLPAELKLIVLSERGYPSYLLPVVTRLLQEEPELPFYLLHDASANGKLHVARLRDSGRFPLEARPVSSLGIDPADTETLPGRSMLPSDDLVERQAIDTIPYRSLVGLIAEAIATTPPQTLAAIWREKRMAQHAEDVFIIGDSDFG